MGHFIQLLRTRVGVALVGAVLVGGLGAALGAGSAWRPSTPAEGVTIQGSATATAVETATPAPTATIQPTPTSVPTAVPTPTRTLVGSTIRGKVVRVDTGDNTLIISRNDVRYTIVVNDETTYSGAATQLSDIQQDWRVSVTIAAQNGSAYLAQRVSASLPDN